LKIPVTILFVKVLFSLTLADADIYERWHIPTKGKIISSPAVMHGIVVFADTEGIIYGHDATNGQPVWQYQTDGSIYASPIIAGDRVYIGSLDHFIYCLDLFTGICVWSFMTRNEIKASVSVYKGNIYADSSDTIMYCLDAETGKKNWSFETSGKILTAPAIQNNCVVFSNSNGYFYSINADTGYEIWQEKSKTNYTAPLVLNTHFVVADCSGQLFKFNQNSIQKIFSITGRLTSSPVYYFESIYIGSENGYMYCIHQDDEPKKKWEYFAGAGIKATPVISMNRVYFGNLNGNFYCINYNDGREYHVFSIKDLAQPGIESTAAIYGKQIFFGAYSATSKKGQLYCLLDDDLADNTENWPMFRHDPLNTGNSDYRDDKTGQRWLQVRQVIPLKRYRIHLFEGARDNSHIVPDHVSYQLSNPEMGKITGVSGNIIEALSNGLITVNAYYQNQTYSTTVLLMATADSQEQEDNNNYTHADEFNPDTFLSAALSTDDIDFFHLVGLSDNLAEISFIPVTPDVHVQMDIRNSDNMTILTHDTKKGPLVCAFPTDDYYLCLKLNDTSSSLPIQYYIHYSLKKNNQTVYLTVVNKNGNGIYINDQNAVYQSFQQSFPVGSHVVLKAEHTNSDDVSLIQWQMPELETMINPVAIDLTQHRIIHCNVLSDPDNSHFHFKNETKGIIDGRVNHTVYNSTDNPAEKNSCFPVNGHIGIAFDDMDKDGDSDLIYIAGSIIHFFENEGSPKIHAWKKTDIEISHSAETIMNFKHPNPAFMDYDSDGDNDLFVADQNQIFYFIKIEGTHFKLHTDYFRSFTNNENLDISFSDFDLDQDIDFFTFISHNNIFDFFLNENISINKRNVFQEPIPFFNNMPDLDRIKKILAIQCIDINNDRLTDLLVASPGGLYAFVKHNEIWMPAQKLIDLPESVESMDFSVVDIDTDSDLDIFYTIANTGIFFHENLDNNLFVSPLMATIENNESITFTCASHAMPVTWTPNAFQSNGKIDPNTGEYKSGDVSPGLRFDWKQFKKTIAPSSLLTAAINLPYDYTINQLAVTVDIQHPQVDSIMLTLVTPDHQPVNIDNHFAGTNIQQTFLLSEFLLSKESLEKNIRGTWQLVIDNTSTSYSGTLNHWAILDNDRDQVMDRITVKDAYGNMNYACVNIVHKYDLTQAGTVIIVAGTKKNDFISKNIKMLSRFAYQTFQYLGYSDSAILFFSPYDDNGVDYLSTSPKIKSEIKKVSTEKLIIYFVSHGGSSGAENIIYLNEHDSITANQLNESLNSFQETGEKQVTVIIDTCNANNIMQDLVSNEYQRTLIASSKTTSTTIDADGLLSFSSFLFSNMFINPNVGQSFQYASEMMTFLFDQSGAINTDCNNLSNQANDIEIANQQTFGLRVIGSDRPVLMNGPDSRIIGLHDQMNINIWTELYSRYPIAETRVKITEVKSENDTMIPGIQKDLILEWLADRNQWARAYKLPEKRATYSFSIISQDVWGNKSMPYSFCIKRDEKEKVIILTSASENDEFTKVVNDIIATAQSRGLREEKSIYVVTGSQGLTGIQESLHWAEDADKLIFCIIGSESVDTGSQAVQLTDSDFLTADELTDKLNDYQTTGTSKRVMIVSELVAVNQSLPTNCFHEVLIDNATENVARSIISNRNTNDTRHLFFMNFIFSKIKNGASFEEAYHDAVSIININATGITMSSHNINHTSTAEKQIFELGIDIAGNNNPVTNVFPASGSIHSRYDTITIGAEVNAYTEIASAYAYVLTPLTVSEKIELSLNINEMRYESDCKLTELGKYQIELFFQYIDGEVTSPVRFSFESISNMDPYEPDDTFETAKSIELGESQIHTFHCRDDLDWLSFSIAANTGYDISITNMDSGVDAKITAEKKPVCENRTLLNTRLNTRFQSIVVHDCSGVYYFQIENNHAFNNSTSRYRVMVLKNNAGETGTAFGKVLDYCDNEIPSGYLITSGMCDSNVPVREDGYNLDSPSGDLEIRIYNKFNEYIGTNSILIEADGIHSINLSTQLIDLNCDQQMNLEDVIVGLQRMGSFPESDDSCIFQQNNKCQGLSSVLKILQLISEKKSSQ